MRRKVKIGDDVWGIKRKHEECKCSCGNVHESSKYRYVVLRGMLTQTITRLHINHKKPSINYGLRLYRGTRQKQWTVTWFDEVYPTKEAAIAAIKHLPVGY